MAENEEGTSKKQDENVSETFKHSEDDRVSDVTINEEEMNDINESDDVIYTHPVVTEKKGYIDLTDYRRNYEDMERHKTQIPRELPEPRVSDKPLEKREDDTAVSKTFTNENDTEKDVDEPEAKNPGITEKNENDKIDTVTNFTKKNGKVSIGSVHGTNDLENDSSATALTDVSPEEAYMQHMERVIATNALPLRNMEILKDLYSSYNFSRTQAATPEETYTGTDIDTSELSESKTDTGDQMEKEPMHDEKPIPRSSFKDSKNIIQSSTQEISKNSVLTESSVTDVDKLGSLENTTSFANNSDILTSTPKASSEKTDASSDIDIMKNVQCDVASMTIENPFSDFSLQTLKLRTGLGSISVAKDNRKALPDSSIPSTSQNVLSNESYETFVRDFLVCNCPEPEVVIASNRNDNGSIFNRIRQHFLSLLIDYLVPRQVPTTKSKVSRYF